MSGKLLMNEQIKSSEVLLTGLNGESLGVLSRQEALALAKEAKADLVCTSLMSSPPPCKLVSRGSAKAQRDQENKESRLKEGSGKVKELRLTPDIEDHDYDTKLRQAAKLLDSGNRVLLVVKISGKEGPKAKALLERLVADLSGSGKKATGIQLSGKQAAVEMLPA
ncbi:translation initiation factor IF-3 [Paenibacillus sp. MY03]|jgi:translation initiation factor IF-3|uniref:translation initiation factor IF-3 n=1 Tax=Paenibacillus sp. MY03 TaxID=302980 RepID=UPI000B3CE7E7|nr:translation initiation factor IF-3 [Paenibacillus sp. MY03]OUS69361.1 translation initiation factor IF-3 [Paenibacillus sp. MY03]